MVSGTFDELNKFIKKKGWDELLPETSGRWHHEEGVRHYIFVKLEDKEKLTLWEESVLAHEVLHMTFSVLDRAGIIYCDESEEAFAYYFQFMFVECLKRLV